MHMINDKGEAVYFNYVRKNNKDYWVVKGIGSTVVYGRDRRKLKKQGIQVPKDPSINIKLSDLGRDIMTPTMEQAMMHEINQQCLEADKRFSLDLDTMVIWTLYQCYGWRGKRLHDFYLAMAKEHRRMREFYEMDDLYPERYKLKEKGIDLEKWQEEVLHNDP